MSRNFITVSTEDEIQLMLIQYLSMGWPDADIDEIPLANIVDEKLPPADAIIIGGVDPMNPTVGQIIEKSNKAELPPVIVLGEIGKEDPVTDNFLLLEDLTPTRLNGVIAEAIKRHADGMQGKSPVPAAVTKQASRADNELPLERIEGLKGYRLIRELGRGGMSRVYLAEDNDTGEEIAIKVLDMSSIEDERMIERFIREYAMLSSLGNIHVASILDQTFTDKYAFIIMERFQGGDLTRRIRAGITPKQAINYLKQMATGLQQVHKQGIVHRDLKPGNILFRLDETLAILDFGLAQMDDGDVDLTKHGEVFGTPSYVSPEQARGKRVDHRSDIYSCGIILYQMLTGKKPFNADNPMAMFYQHVHAQIPQLEGELAEYQPLLERMLAKSANDRFQSMTELIEALQKYE